MKEVNNVLARGKLRVTEQLLHELLQLPEGIVITDSKYDSDRDVISFYLRSAEPIEGLTYELGEGLSVPESQHAVYLKE